MRCIEALGEWSQLHSLSETYWDQVKIRHAVAYVPYRYRISL